MARPRVHQLMKDTFPTLSSACRSILAIWIQPWPPRSDRFYGWCNDTCWLHTKDTVTVSEPAGLSKSERGKEVLRGAEAQPAALKAQRTSDFVKVVNTLRVCCECEHEASCYLAMVPSCFLACVIEGLWYDDMRGMVCDWNAGWWRGVGCEEITQVGAVWLVADPAVQPGFMFSACWLAVRWSYVIHDSVVVSLNTKPFLCLLCGHLDDALVSHTCDLPTGGMWWHLKQTSVSYKQRV